jgi:PAS domain S-box-containing protein
MSTRNPSVAARYGFTIVVVALATLLRVALGGVLGAGVPFITYFPTVVVCAWFGGLWPGLLSTVISGVIAWYAFLAPEFSFGISGPNGFVQLIMFLLAGILISLLAESLHGARRRAERSETAEREQRERLRVTLASIGDAVITTDVDGRVTFINKVAESLTGWQEQDLEGKRLEELFRIVNEETGATVENPALRAMQEGTVIGLTNHSILIARDGTEIPIDDSGAPIKDAEGKTIGAVLIFRDITERRRVEKDRALLAGIVESSQDAIISKSLDGIIESWNAAAEHMYEYSAGEAIGQPITIIIPEEKLEEEKFILERLRQGERIEHFETVRLTKSGTPLDVSLTVSPVRDSAGHIIGASKTARDITERKKVEEALHQHREWLRVTLSSIGDAVITTDTDGVVTFLNPVAESLTGWTLEEAKGRPLEKVFKVAAEQTRQLVENPALRAMKEGIVVGLANHSVLIAKDGTEIPIDDSGAPITGSDGRILGAVLIFRDVTERRRSEESLRQQAALLDLSGEAIFAWELDGPIVYWNRGAEALYGFTREQAVGQISHRLLNTIHPSDFEDFRAELLQQKEITTELVHTARDGRTVRVESRQQLVLGPDERHLVLETNRDITQRKRVEEDRLRLLASERAARAQAEAASRAKDEFVAMVSHELRAPLNSILGWTQLLRTGKFDASETAHALETVEHSAKAQAQLIEDLMDISRVITGKLVLNVVPVELGRVVDSAVDSIRSAADAKQIKVAVHLDPRGSWVSGDPSRLQQIIWNLVSNAVKFTPARGRVEVTVERVDSQHQITVSDSGPGINAEFLPFVFDRFTQASMTSERRYGGLGLGLAIVKNLVELHGGTVRADSSGDGKGATFKVAFPSTEVYEEPHDLLQPTAKDANALDGLRVMIVDDERDTRDLLTLMLSGYGAEIRACASAAEALRTIEQWRPAVLVSDIGMRDEDGYSLIKQLRSRGPEQGGDIPAVALTGYARSEDRTRALSAGFQMHVPKPVEAAELMMVIASLTGRTGKSTPTSE